MRYGSRAWFNLTPDEIRLRRMRRQHENVSGLAVFEPADDGEASYLWRHMREEERQETDETGCREEDHLLAIMRAERSFAVYHDDALLAIATVVRMPDGRRLMSMERTVHALERGHRFTWLKAYGPLSRTLTELVGDVVFVTPCDMPRALDVYRHAGAEQTGETVKVGGREYWVLRLRQRKEDCDGDFL